jgi:hypothetical protein
MLICSKCGTSKQIRKRTPRGDGIKYGLYCPKCMLVSINGWKARNREAAQAHQIVARAKRRGKPKPAPCAICGSRKHVEAHHPDYAEPLNVEWLCRNHHRQHHREARQ